MYFKRLLLLFSTGILFASSLYIDIEDKEEAFLIRRIVEFWKDQDYDIVRNQIESFLKEYPKSKLREHLTGMLGDLFLVKENYNQALLLYSQIKSEPLVPTILVNKLQCMYELSMYNRMIEEGVPFVDTKNKEVLSRIDEFNFLLAEAYFKKALEETKDLELISTAETFYKKVVKTEFQNTALYALAEIEYIKKNYKASAQTFLHLSTLEKSKSEEMLFWAALSQAKYDPLLSVDTLTTVVNMGGKQCRDAMVNIMILQFGLNNYQDVIDYYQKISKFSTKDVPVVDYLVGVSFFYVKDYKSALIWLESYVNNAPKNGDFKNAMLTILATLDKLDNSEKYILFLNKFAELFPEDPELPNATFLHAMMLKRNKKYGLLENQLKIVVDQFPNYVEKNENVKIEYGIAIYQNGDAYRSYQIFNDLKEGCKEEAKEIVWKYFLSISLNLVNNLSVYTNYSKKQFYKDIGAVIDTNILSEQEKKEVSLMRGKIAYEIDLYKGAIEYLKDYLQKYDDQSGEAHLVLALCYQQENNPELFCSHAELALNNLQNLQNNGELHLALYNVYLLLVEREHGNKEDLESRGALHLYTAMLLKDFQIEEKNKLWLTNYYFNKGGFNPQYYQVDNRYPTENSKEAFDKCYNILSHVLLKEGKLKALSNPIMEWEVLRISYLMGKYNKREEQMELLQSLVEQQTNDRWQLKEEAMFELAKIYESLGLSKKALETFEFITNYSTKHSLVTELAKLHTLRLQFGDMYPEEKNLENKELLKGLNLLKEFQIRKHPNSEPLHIEASLEYAWIRSQITPKNSVEKYLFYLNRIQEDFDNLEDPNTLEYKKILDLEQNNLKDILQEYNTFLLLEIKRSSYMLAIQNGRLERSTKLHQELKKDLTKLAQTTLSYYLKFRIEQSLNSIDDQKI